MIPRLSGSLMFDKVKRRLTPTRHHVLVIPSRADGEGPLSRTQVTQWTLPRSTRRIASNTRDSYFGDRRPTVRSLAVCAARDDTAMQLLGQTQPPKKYSCMGL